MVDAALLLTVLLAQQPLVQQSSRMVPDVSRSLPPNIAMFRAWVEAGERHEPGVDDAPLRQVAELGSEQMVAVLRETATYMALVRDPRMQVFRTVEIQNGRSREVEIRYNRGDLARLREMAKQARASADPNRVVKRGARLHGDIAMLVPPLVRPMRAGQPLADLQTLRIRTRDGEQTGLGVEVAHLTIAVRLLDQVTPVTERMAPGDASPPLPASGLWPAAKPNPAADPFVRLWYRAWLSHMVRQMDYGNVLFERAGQLFPADADIQFLIGSRHETMAASITQVAMDKTDLPRQSWGIGSVRDELEAAETSFRSVLALRTDDVEARVRLGRVLALRGRFADAVVELRRVQGDGLASPLDYFAALFLGHAIEGTGDLDGARAAYQRAAARFPAASAPMLALSALAARAGDRQTTAALALEAMARPDRESPPDEPLWEYLTWSGRLAPDLFRELAAQ